MAGPETIKEYAKDEVGNLKTSTADDIVVRDNSSLKYDTGVIRSETLSSLGDSVSNVRKMIEEYQKHVKKYVEALEDTIKEFEEIDNNDWKM